jgi:hypothetical protein
LGHAPAGAVASLLFNHVTGCWARSKIIEPLNIDRTLGFSLAKQRNNSAHLQSFRPENSGCSINPNPVYNELASAICLLSMQKTRAAKLVYHKSGQAVAPDVLIGHLTIV